MNPIVKERYLERCERQLEQLVMLMQNPRYDQPQTFFDEAGLRLMFRSMYTKQCIEEQQEPANA